VDGIIGLFEKVTTSPQELNSAGEFLPAFLVLLGAALLLCIPAAVLSKILLERDKLGTATRLSLAIGRTAVLLGAMAVSDAVGLVLLDRAPHWTAVLPHCTFAALAGVCGLLEYRSVSEELKQMRRYVEAAKRPAA